MGNVFSPETDNLEITISKLQRELKDLHVATRNMLSSHEQERTRLFNEVDSHIQQISEEKEINKMLREDIQRSRNENIDLRQQIDKEKEQTSCSVKMLNGSRK